MMARGILLLRHHSLMLILWLLPTASLVAQEATGRSEAADWLPALVALVIVAVIIAVFVVLFVLQRQFLLACRENHDLSTYAQLPLGVPEGSIRAVLAMTVVFASLGYVALTMLPGQEIKFPEVMAGILGTVLGFYFGTRAQSGRGTQQALQQIGTATRQRDEAIEVNKKSKLGAVVNKARNVVGIAQTLKKILPDEIADKVDRVAKLAEQGLDAADRLAGEGQTSAALDKAEEVAHAIEKGDPVHEIIARAASTFGQVVGPAVPGLAVVSVLVSTGSRLAGAAYERWKARVLNAPFTPELFPPTVIDATTGISLLRRSPIFREKFQQEIQNGDLAFVRRLVDKVFDDDARSKLWADDAIASRFEDRAELECGLDQFQRAAMTEEVSKDIDPGVAAGAFGVERFFETVDALNANKQTQCALDALMLAIDALKRQGKEVETVFQEAIQRVRADSSEQPT